ncbi:MAG: TOMM precursor leader peptide-binding protein [Rhodospirillales bacterium]|nr:TOMM precursor leader peptide-binding protein [Rhodospirillales bacterium]
MSPPQGILKKVSAEDRGLIERPVLAPHLDFYPVDEDQTLLVSETFNTLLRGPVYGDLLPLLDGRPADDLAAALAGAHVSADVHNALAGLASRGYAVSGDHSMDRGRAAYWSSLGASPRWAEQRLAEARVVVDGDGGLLSQPLEAMGIAVNNDGPTLSVVVCADYLDEGLDSINRRHLGSGAPWMPVRPKGMAPLFGPVFRPADEGPCWACLAYRLGSHQEVHNFLRNLAGDEAAFRPNAAEPAVLDAIYGLVAAEIAKWLVLEEAAALHGRAISLDAGSLGSAHHPVMRRPQCAVCGDPALHRIDRPPVPVRLQSSPAPISNSGGVRSVAPEETIARYRHLVDPVGGVVTWVARRTEEDDPWLHVYWAGSNAGLRGRTLSSLRRSLRSKSAGKGGTRAQSEASALCEAIERYSGAFHGDEIRCRKRFADFAAAGDGAAIHPNDVQLFSERQLDNAAAINARGHPYNMVPPRLDPEAEIDWSPVWSLTQERHLYLPTSMLYGAPAELRGDADLIADSNGCAAGNTLEEAILQGFFELVERDAFAIWWYNRLAVPGVDLESFGDDYLARAPDYYSRRGRELWVLDVTQNLGIPVFAAVSRRTGGDTEDIIYGAGAHTDPRIAALRAVCELNQCLAWLPEGGSGPAIDDPLALGWWKTGRLADHPYLAPAAGAPSRGKADYAVPDTADVLDEVDRCRSLVEARGMEFLVLDQTRPDIGMPVVRVIVPGLRHFWERFAPGRLYDVPVEMGRCDRALAEDELNPVPVIA